MEINGKTLLLLTTDEAMFNMGGSCGRRQICYLRKHKFVKRDSFARGFMAWAGVSYRGMTEIRIIDKGTKVNSKYYFEHVLKPFLDKNVPRLFPDDPESMVFYQDSASSHTARATIQFLKNNNVNFIDK